MADIPTADPIETDIQKTKRVCEQLGDVSYRKYKNVRKRWRTAMSRREPSKWLVMIMSIYSDHVRAKVAAIVWWDWFSTRMSTERWPHLDHFLKEPDEIPVPSEIVQFELERLGYPTRDAKKRSTQGEWGEWDEEFSGVREQCNDSQPA